MSQRVSLVIPAYEGGQELLDCLASVAASELQPESIIVVDNASTDGSVEQAKRHFPQIEIIHNPQNRGFGAACNQGIERALAGVHDFVLLLNQDAFLEPTTLGLMVEFADTHPRAAVVGSQTLSTRLGADGSPILLYNGSWRTWLPLWQRIPEIGRSSRAATSEPREVDYVWGHGMLLRCLALQQVALQQVGAFDPGFFMYFEDLDLCRRMQQAGWQIWCDSRAVIRHAIGDGARASQSQAWRWRMKVESARYFHRKHFARPKADVLWCLTTLREAISLLRTGHPRAVGHLLRAWGQVAAGDSTPHIPGT